MSPLYRLATAGRMLLVAAAGLVARGLGGSGAPAAGFDGGGEPSVARPSGLPGVRRVRLGLLLAPVVAVGSLLALGVAPAAADSCPNAALRVGPSANLPDCRAYELVSPADAGGAFMTGRFSAFGIEPEVSTVASSGDSVVFGLLGQVLPGVENPEDAPGQADLYQAMRGSNGWVTRYVGVTVAEFDRAGLGTGEFRGPYAVSRDQRTFAFATDPSTLRTPDGGLEPVGVGSLGSTDARVRWISDNAGHVIFETTSCALTGCAKPLEPDAPPAGTGAIYDRTPGGATRVVSLLPGEATPVARQSATYEGVSQDGSAVAFTIGGPVGLSSPTYAALYVRLHDAATQFVARRNAVQAGQKMTCTGGPTSATLSYQWLRNGVPIAGATGATYTTTSADAGRGLQCQVFANGASAGSTQVSSIITDPTGFTHGGGVVVDPFPVTEPPTVSSNPFTGEDAPLTVGGGGGQTLTCNPGSWTGSPSFAFQWYRNGSSIAGATSASYVTTAADVTTPAVFQCAVTGTNAGGAATRVSANLATSPAPSPAAPAASATTAGLWINFAGLSDDGSELFYEQGAPFTPGGDLFRVDTSSGSVKQLTHTGDVTVVNVSADGSHVYFSSRSQLDGSNGTSGEPNLYVWDRDSGTIRFIAALDPADLALATDPISGAELPSLARWIPTDTSQQAAAARPDGSALDTSRTTPDGSVLVFESRARVTSYDNQGRTEVYRYDATDGSLVCVSCDPNGAAPVSDAHLESVGVGESALPDGPSAKIDNVTDDGQTVFFETTDPLVPADTNGKQDVYEWHEGSVALISSGRSGFDSYLYGMSADGRDVVFITSQALAPQDENGGAAVVYDARVDGGFPAPSAPSVCIEDACQGAATGTPPAQPVASVTFTGPGNLAQNATTPKVRVLTKVVHGAPFLVRVRVSANGRVSITGPGIKTVRHSFAKAGTYRLRVRLTAKEQRAVKRKHGLRLTLRVRFTPASGRASTARVKLTVTPALRRPLGRNQTRKPTGRTSGGAR